MRTEPAAIRRGSLGRDLAAFTLPAAVLSSLIGLLLFYGAILAHAGIGQEPSRMTVGQYLEAVRSVTPQAQTVLSAFLVLGGLLLVVFVAPPAGWWAVAAPVREDRRPRLLAAGLAILFAVVLLTPLRWIFALQALSPAELALVVAAVMVWLVIVRAAWSGRVVERFVAFSDERK